MNVNMALAAALIAQPVPDADSCRAAISTYNSAVSEVSYTSRRYTTCVSNSNGTDDCDIEFRRLRNAQDDFETAVNSYKSECEQ